MSFSEDFNEMLEDAEGGIGQWLVIRHFSNVKSEYWNEETKEAVGGPAYEYEDTVVLAAKQTAFSPSRPSAQTGVTVFEYSAANMNTYRYFLKSDATISVDDEIFDLDAVGDTTPTVSYDGTGTGASITGRYKVRFVHPYVQGGKGEIGYKIAVANDIPQHA